jgi:hypothetical protein
VTIAQTINVSGASEDFLAQATPMGEAMRAFDGCEGLYSLADSKTGEGIAIILWRDEAAMEAALAQQATDTEALQRPGVTITQGKVYDTVLQL